MENKNFNEANDVLETAEIIRGINIFTRMSVGIVSFSDSIAGRQVLSDEEKQEYFDSVSLAMSFFERLYEAFMLRYSVLKESVDSRASVSDFLDKAKNGQKVS